MKNFIVLIISIFILSFTIAETYFSGNLRSVNGPIKDVDVVLKKAPGNEVVKETKADENGFFRFEDIKSGNYLIEAGPIVLDTDNAILEGEFSMSPDVLLAGKNVLIKNKEENLEFSVEVNEQNQFHFEGIPAGAYTLYFNFEF